MRHYHDTLSSQIRRLGSDPEKLFKFADFQKELQKFGQYPFLFGPVFVQHYLTDSKDLQNFDEISEKMSKESVDLMRNEFHEETQQLYKQRQNELLEDLVSFGYWG